MIISPALCKVVKMNSYLRFYFIDISKNNQCYMGWDGYVC